MSTFGVSLSGLNAAWTQVAVAGTNLANLNTEGYKAKRVDIESTVDGGVRPSAVQESQAPFETNGSNVDPAREMVGLVSGSAYLKANTRVLDAQAEMLGTVMDIKA